MAKPWDIYKSLAGKEDMQFPAIYVIMGLSMIAFGFKDWFLRHRRYWLLLLIPLLAGLFDFWENMNTIGLIEAFQANDPKLDQ